MANDITKNPLYLDTAGVVTTAPLWIKAVLFVPNAAADAATLKFWYENSERALMRRVASTATDTNTLTSTGNFEATEVVVTDAIKIFESSTGYNLGTWAVTVRNSDDSIDVAPATLHAESDKVYSWKTFASYPLIGIKSQATTLKPEFYYFGDKGLYTPNLMITALSTSAVIYLYV